MISLMISREVMESNNIVFGRIKNPNNKEMLAHILDFPKLIGWALDSNIDLYVDLEQPKRISWYGMGASALIGEYVKYYMDHALALDVSLEIHRSNFVRKSLASDLLVIYTYSGNTYESIEVIKEISRRGLQKKTIIFSSGGKAEEIAKRENICYIKLVGGYVSRSHLPFGVALASKVLAELLNEWALQEFGDYRSYLREIVSNEELLQQLWDFAKILEKKIPVIIADHIYSPLGKRFMAQLNENAKNVAMFFEVPEGGHNFIVGLRDRKNDTAFLVIKRTSADSFIEKYLNIVLSMLTSSPNMEFTVMDDSVSWKTYMQPTLLIDLISIFLAEIKGHSAFDIDEIVKIKTNLLGE